MSAPQTARASPATAFCMTRGECRVLFAFDVGYAMDLDAARRALVEQGARVEARASHPHGGPPVFRPEPLRFRDALPVTAPEPWAAAGVEVALFDFGAFSLTYRIELQSAGWDDLQRLAVALDEDRLLVEDARRRVGDLVRRLGPAVSRPGESDLVEDYVVFRAQDWTSGASDGPAAHLVRDAAEPMARVLRASPSALSEFEVRDAVSCAIGYGPSDLTVIDWKAAMVFDKDPADILSVLEFANVELLEMRFIDDRLDGILERAYQAVAHRHGGALFAGRLRDEHRRIAALQMENALLFEGVSNAIKLIGDQFLSRVYREAARRFHMAEWDAGVLRKLETVERVYQKIGDEQQGRRMELLEWIIIVLIAVSIVVPFVLGSGK